MRILGIDTATSTASVALVENGTIVADESYSQTSCRPESKLNRPNAGHTEIILPLIEAVLAAARCSFVNVDAMAVSIGPGSFTGLRIGLSTVKGIAYRWQHPVAGVSTLWANAARVTDFVGIVCSLFDARKKEVYVSFFRRSEDALTRLTEDRLAPFSAVLDQVLDLADGEACLFIGDGATLYEDVIRDSLGKRSRCCSGEGYPSIASAVARLGEERLQSSGGDFLSEMAPVYLRLSEAEVKRREQR
jgi:tRNA threonylcarbamoyladenosine biosynthesis protein TsaB